MPLDFGMYNALKQQPLVEKRMQLEQANMAYLQQFSQLASQKREKRLKAQQLIQQQTQLFNEIDVMERDKSDLTALIKSEEAKITKEIAQVGGDPYRYLNTGGTASLQNYYSRIRQSEELTKALGNKDKQKRYLDSLQQGMIAIPSAMKIDGQDQIVSFSEQLELYNNGVIDEIQWQGAQKPVEISAEAVAKMVNPANPLVRANVPVTDYYTMLISKGQHPLIAQERATKADVGNGLTSLMYGVDQVLYRNYMSSRMGLGEGKSPDVDVLDRLQKGGFNTYNNIHEIYYTSSGVVKDYESAEPGEKVFYEKMSYSSIKDPEEIDYITSLVGVTKIKDKQYIKLDRSRKYFFPGAPSPITMSPEGEGEYRVKRTDIVYVESGEVQKGYNNERYNNIGKSKAMVKVVLKDMDEDKVNKRFRDAVTGPIYKTGVWTWDRPQKGFERAVKETDKGVEVTMLIPIEYGSLAAEKVGRPLPFLSERGQAPTMGEDISYTETMGTTNYFSY